MKIIVLNGGKVNYDGSIDYGTLSAEGDEVVVYETCRTEDVPSMAEGAEVLISKELPLPAGIIEQLPDSVKLIAEAGTGYNNIDLAACEKKGIGVANVPAYSSERVAHTAAMLMLNLASTMQTQMKMLAQGDRRNFTEHLLVPHMELNGKTLGVIGAGHIGQKMIRIGLAMDMKVLVYNRSVKALPEGAVQTDLETVLKEADVVSLHCPLTDATRHLINEQTLALMKPTAFLINTARGALVDEAALTEALKAGKLGGAGLDVQETEPPVAESPLYTLPNVVLTPHMGWKGYETRQRLLSILRDDIDGYRKGLKTNRVL